MKINYFVLDANVIYNYIGRDKLGLPSDLKFNQQRLKRLLDKSTLFISTSVLAEIFVHFRNNLDKIRDIIIFLHEHIDYVLVASTNCADGLTIDSLILAQNDTEREKILSRVLESKASIETYVAYVFAGAIVAIIGDLLLEDTKKRVNSNADVNKYSRTAMDEILSNRDYMIKKGNADLLNFYAQLNKDSAGMKKIYDEFLITNFKSYEKQLFKFCSDNDPTFSLDKESYFNSLSLSKSPKNMYTSMARFISDFKKNKNYKKLIEDKIVTVCGQWTPFDNWQKIYLASRFEVYLGNTKFKKNDVFDTMFLGVFKEESINEINRHCIKKGMSKCSRENFHLLSFDVDVSNFIYVVDRKGALIADRIRKTRLYPDSLK